MIADLSLNFRIKLIGIKIHRHINNVLFLKYAILNQQGKSSYLVSKLTRAYWNIVRRWIGLGIWGQFRKFKNIYLPKPCNVVLISMPPIFQSAPIPKHAKTKLNKHLFLSFRGMNTLTSCSLEWQYMIEVLNLSLFSNRSERFELSIPLPSGYASTTKHLPT